MPVNNSTGYWEFTAGGYSFGSNKTTTGQIGGAIADTGTSLLFLPPQVAVAYYDQVPGSYPENDTFVFPCQSQLPNFNVMIGGTLFTVPGNYLNFSQYSGDYCYGAIQFITGFEYSIFGDIFLKSVYAIFHPNVPQLGFANPPT